MADLVIRNASIIDGTGAPATHGDVEVTGDRITAVGDVIGTGHREIDADGLLVTPGWVDIHTHFDGQVTWDPIVAPSSLARRHHHRHGQLWRRASRPASPDRHDWLISLLEGVEDIPGTALAEGLTWDWETFPQYLDSAGGEAPHRRHGRARSRTPRCAPT